MLPRAYDLRLAEKKEGRSIWIVRLIFVVFERTLIIHFLRHRTWWTPTWLKSHLCLFWILWPRESLQTWVFLVKNKRLEWQYLHLSSGWKVSGLGNRLLRPLTQVSLQPQSQSLILLGGKTKSCWQLPWAVPLEPQISQECYLFTPLCKGKPRESKPLRVCTCVCSSTCTSAYTVCSSVCICMCNSVYTNVCSSMCTSAVCTPACAPVCAPACARMLWGHFGACSWDLAPIVKTPTPGLSGRKHADNWLRMGQNS